MLDAFLIREVGALLEDTGKVLQELGEHGNGLGVDTHDGRGSFG